MASSSVVPVVPSFGFSPISEKLTRANYRAWSAQVLSAIKGAQLFSFIKPTVVPPLEFLLLAKGEDKDASSKPNPEYDTWIAKGPAGPELHPLKPEEGDPLPGLFGEDGGQGMGCN
jgi:hypothetical protein